MSQQQLGKVKTRCPGKGLPPGRKRSLKPGVALSELMAPDPTGCSVDGHTHMCTHTCANTGAHTCAQQPSWDAEHPVGTHWFSISTELGNLLHMSVLEHLRPPKAGRC